jgi:hypothetical protein
MSNLFSFSLFESGRNNFDMYAYGAIENYYLIRNKYPNFKARYYIQIDKIQNKYVKELMKTDAEIVFKENHYPNQKGVLWRFQPLIEGNFNICFFRDCDSRIMEREDKLNILCINSNKKYHVIRDKPHNNKILAGMWGVKSTNKEMSKCIGDLYNMEDSYGFEEYYFEKTMWNYIKNDLLLHDFKLNPKEFIQNKDGSFIGKSYKTKRIYEN